MVGASNVFSILSKMDVNVSSLSTGKNSDVGIGSGEADVPSPWLDLDDFRLWKPVDLIHI